MGNEKDFYDELMGMLNEKVNTPKEGLADNFKVVYDTFYGFVNEGFTRQEALQIGVSVK